VALIVIGGIIPGLVYAVTTAAPVVLFCSLALRNRTWTDGQTYWYPPGHLLRACSLWVGALLLAVAITLSMVAGGFEAAIGEMVSGFLNIVGQQQGLTMQPERMQALAQALPGITAWSWMVMATVNGLLAQLLVRRFGRNIRPTPKMADIQVPLSWCAAFGATAAIGFVLPGDAGYTLMNLAFVMAFPLLFQGLSVVHVAFARWGLGRGAYVAAYAAIVMLISWLGLAVVALGLAEPVFRLRERLARPKNV
jgi:uncharacterized protein YybS (DUF2232 family)